MRLTKTNKALSVVNIVIALYILLTPFLPTLLFWIRQRVVEPPVIASQAVNEPQPPEFPKDNRLVVPSLLLDEPINEGSSSSTLNKGIWRRPHTVTPDVSGNTVLAGHVFTYDDPEGVFYHLNKVEVGEQLAVYWNSSEYLYEVAEKKEVSASAVEIEAQTDNPRLTLYTCTPLWNPVNRLVIIANLIKVTEAP